MNSRIASRSLAAVAMVCLAALPALLSGCSRPYGVPGFSAVVAEAPNGQMTSFQAPDDGTVYVTGPGNQFQPRHIVYSGLIHRGEILAIDPSSGRLTVNGKTQMVTIEGGKSSYQVWYQQQNVDWY